MNQWFDKPSWSVQSLLDPERSAGPIEPVTKAQLHHFLRLSALPLPKSDEEEQKMIRDLQAQLRFVKAVQRVDTEGIEPLQSIRDETVAGRQRNTFNVENMKEVFDQEEVVGRRGRIRRKQSVQQEQSETDNESKWNPLAHAAKTRGPYFVVDTAKD